ncbi:MAG: YciI family protein [Marmoricola sp.]
MAEYLIAFNQEWVPDQPEEWFKERARALKPIIAEMREAGVLIFTGGLDPEAPTFNVDAASGTPVFTDGPFAETKEHLGGFAVVDVPDEESLRHWAGQIAIGCAWPQQVTPFMRPFQPIENE